MATYYVSHTGNNTTGTSWATAMTTLAAGLALATADGDIVLVDHTHTGDNAIASDTIWTPPSGNLNCSIIAVNTGTGALAEMGTSAWIGHSSSNRSVTFNSAAGGKVYLRGLTLRTAGSSNDWVNFCTGNNTHVEAESCYLWQGNTNSNGHLFVGSPISDNEAYARFVNCTLRFGHASQFFYTLCPVEFYGCTISSDGVAQNTLFVQVTSRHTGSSFYAEGCDFSYSAASPTVVSAGAGATGANFTFVNCKIPPSATLFSGGGTNKAIGEASFYNCASGDTHYHIAHADAMGSTIVETTIVANDGASFDGGTTKTSWKIATTSNATFFAPYISPWFDKYHTGTSAITPFMEILRDGSATAYDNDEVWGEWSYQGTSGSTMSTLISDRMTPLATPAAQDNGVGLSGWSGESGTAWSGKLQATSSITPAEIGYLRGRVVVGLPSSTVYVDPTIRT
jgi:hypothetical protein